MVVTNRKDVYESVALNRTHGITHDPSLMEKCDGNWYYEMIELGFNYRLTDIQAALGYLGYDCGRTDGYFNEATSQALAKFAADNELSFDGTLTKDLYEAVVSALILDWNTTDVHDTQLHKAQEILNG